MGKEDGSFYSKQIVREDIPCWYELSWSEQDLAILLRLHNDFIGNVPILSDQAPLVRSLAESHQLGSFGGNFREDIGFEKCLKNQGERGDFTQYCLELPRVKVASEKRCTMCGGSGQMEGMDSDCFSCGGSGKEHEMVWHAAYCASASLTTLTMLLQLRTKRTSALLPQLLTFETVTRTGLHGGSLSGEISRPLREYLTNYQGSDTLPSVIKAMRSAYNQMYPLSDNSLYARRFKTLIWDNGGLNMDCPGNACGINPDHYMRDTGGYEYGGHNMDSPVQQLTIVAGLAALTDQARQEN